MSLLLLLLESSGGEVVDDDDDDDDEGEDRRRRNGLVRACRHDEEWNLHLLCRVKVTAAEKDSVRDAIEARMRKIIIIAIGEEELKTIIILLRLLLLFFSLYLPRCSSETCFSSGSEVYMSLSASFKESVYSRSDEGKVASSAGQTDEEERRLLLLTTTVG